MLLSVPPVVTVPAGTRACSSPADIATRSSSSRFRLGKMRGESGLVEKNRVKASLATARTSSPTA